MYIETSSGSHGNEVFVSFERTDIIQMKNIIFYYNTISSSDPNLKSIARFKIQLLLAEKTWSTRYNIPKNDQYSDSSTDLALVSVKFKVENYGIKLIYAQIDTPLADMCFIDVTITHSMYDDMDNITQFEDLFESILVYGKIVLLSFSVVNNDNLLKKFGFLKDDIIRFCLDFKKNNERK